jgi:ABC-type cobalamin/Fe3+-siderophores transport system ATPase subunit
MVMLGQVVLKFGATGETGEEPLRFKAGHINLLVGPNNAGKSLMLREISGVNPREERYGYGRIRYPETRVVASVDWSEEVAKSIKEEIVQGAFEHGEPVCAEIKREPWDLLVPKLEQAVKRLTHLRDEVSANLLEMLKTNVSDELRPMLRLMGIDRPDGKPLLILLAVGVLMLDRIAAASPDEKSPAITPAGQQEGEKSLLSREQAAALNQLADTTWKGCQDVFASLGVDAADLTLEGLLNGRSLAGLFLKKASEIPGFNQRLLSDPKLSQLPQADADTIRRFERYAALGGWLLDPGPLERLQKLLADAYTGCTWADPEYRAGATKGVLYLDGLARLEMTRSVDIRPFNNEDEGDPPILALLKSPEAMKRLRAMVASALGCHLVIDIATRAPKVIWRLADEEPGDGLESSFSQAANAYHSRAALLEERSDGIHAFIGMLAAVLAKNKKIVFIDEPEAFLHPPLVRKLARQLVSIAQELDVQFFIATHSADLVESFASVGADVNILRLTHTGERSTARLLDSKNLRQLALDPLLRAESTLSALFYEGAVVCEAVGDRVLYREVNERLLVFEDEGGLESCMFLNAQNWQTTARIIEPLRKMGVAAAVVIDADTLFGSDLTTVLAAAQVPGILRETWLQQRAKLKERLVKRLQPENNKIELKGAVIAELKRSEVTIFEAICASMAEYGVFLVPVGELEDWLSSLSLKRSTEKLKWLRAALDRMGIDPSADGYARPTNGDIWQFMRKVNRWIRDPARKGTSPNPHQDDD